MIENSKYFIKESNDFVNERQAKARVEWLLKGETLTIERIK